jgi:hypothetical protein
MDDSSEERHAARERLAAGARDEAQAVGSRPGDEDGDGDGDGDRDGARERGGQPRGALDDAGDADGLRPRTRAAGRHTRFPGTGSGLDSARSAAGAGESVKRPREDAETEGPEPPAKRGAARAAWGEAGADAAPRGMLGGGLLERVREWWGGRWKGSGEHGGASSIASQGAGGTVQPPPPGVGGGGGGALVEESGEADGSGSFEGLMDASSLAMAGAPRDPICLRGARARQPVLTHACTRVRARGAGGALPSASATLGGQSAWPPMPALAGDGPASDAVRNASVARNASAAALQALRESGAGRAMEILHGSRRARPLVPSSAPTPALHGRNFPGMRARRCAAGFVAAR